MGTYSDNITIQHDDGAVSTLTGAGTFATSPASGAYAIVTVVGGTFTIDVGGTATASINGVTTPHNYYVPGGTTLNVNWVAGTVVSTRAEFSNTP